MSTSSTLNALQQGQLILHGMSRPIGSSTARDLATLFRLTHPLLYNTSRYPGEIVVAGGLVLAATHAASARSLYEILHEEVVDCSFVNRTCADDNIGAMSYVLGITKLNEQLEEVTIRTLGVKNCDLLAELSHKSLPSELFVRYGMRPSEYEELVEKHCPALSKKIICQSVRKLVRQAPLSNSVFLL